MRLAYLSASLVPSRAANSVHVMKMCAALARHGHQVTLYARRGAGADPHGHYGTGGFELKLLRNTRVPMLGAVQYAAAVRGDLERNRVDLLYARHIYSLAAASSLRLPLMFEAHTPPANWLQYRLERWLYQRPNFSRLVVISQALADWYRAAMPELAGKSLVVAHDAADEVEHSGSAPSEQPNRRFSVGYVGQLYAGKGMEIISQLPARLPEIDFHVIGGTEEDLGHWRSRVQAANLSLHGYLPPSSLPARIAQFDVVLAPYQRNVAVYGKQRDISAWMSPLKLFEYMAAGRAMLVSDLPVLREVLQHESNALLVSPDSIDAWVVALRRCLADTQLVRRLGEQAYADFRARHSWAARAAHVLHGC